MNPIIIQDPSAFLSVTDRLGRSLPFYPHVRAGQDRLVGLFYFLWLGEHGRHAPYDLTKIVSAHPDAGFHPDAPYWGGIGTYHHWGEPLYGYYYSDDEWVMRRHMRLIMQAGIDFLFLDVTNAVTYDRNVLLLFSILEQYRRDGFPVPKILFYTNTNSGDTVHHLYETIFKPRLYPALWMMLDGKPLIIAREEEMREEERDFFTVKKSQWPNEPDKEDGWPWMDFTRPQRLFPDPISGRTVMNASVAQHPQLRFGDSALYGEEGNCSRAFHNGKNDPAPDAYLHGYNFEEQMERVLEADPSILLLTGWNEWIAGRWQGTNERPIMFVDTASANYSRDFEMMRDGYGDLYYLQMLASVRRFKGMDPLPVPEIGQTLCFLGTSDGNLHRHAEGYGQVYHNTTGRNAIRSLSLTLEADRLHLSIKTAGPLSPSIEGCFLRTYLTVGDAPAFTHILIPEHDRAILYAACGLTVGAKLASFPLESETDGISFALPYHALGLRGGDALSIKVADAVTEYESTDDFYDIGDTLPLGNLSLRIGLPKEIS